MDSYYAYLEPLLALFIFLSCIGVVNKVDQALRYYFIARNAKVYFCPGKSKSKKILLDNNQENKLASTQVNRMQTLVIDFFALDRKTPLTIQYESMLVDKLNLQGEQSGFFCARVLNNNHQVEIQYTAKKSGVTAFILLLGSFKISGGSFKQNFMAKME